MFLDVFMPISHPVFCVQRSRLSPNLYIKYILLARSAWVPEPVPKLSVSRYWLLWEIASLRSTCWVTSPEQSLVFALLMELIRQHVLAFQSWLLNFLTNLKMAEFRLPVNNFVFCIRIFSRDSHTLKLLHDFKVELQIWSNHLNKHLMETENK